MQVQWVLRVCLLDLTWSNVRVRGVINVFLVSDGQVVRLSSKRGSTSLNKLFDPNSLLLMQFAYYRRAADENGTATTVTGLFS